ncbi:D-alanyl-lipoteichoic acid biosynthesis protein DltD [Achromobacter xylosoxidans]|uniref:D-alanyl-lipoteichoic acid biosynthesis protein DltD n=1 Tax=Alcaligenes xylosoxydans xylosoxydans TaxID=85698 RepID=UPI0022B8813E|nr:D-alanyl-lipoteichoic acid biosynthesis protein DltD [Achromobacter xylosoxidans]MCZ8389614.1 DltD [Achromobacter xylosoxidans]
MAENQTGRWRAHAIAFAAAISTVLLLDTALPRQDGSAILSATHIGNLGRTYEDQQIAWRTLGQALETGDRMIMLGSSELTSSDLRFISYKSMSTELAQPVLAYGHAHFQSLGMYFLLASQERRLSPSSRVVIMLSPGWFATRGLNREAFKEHVLPLLPHLLRSSQARIALATWLRRSGNGDIARATVAEWAYDLRSRLQGQLSRLFLPTQPPAPPPGAAPARARPAADWPALRAEAAAIEYQHMASNPYGVRQDYLDTYLADLTPERLDAFPTRLDGMGELADLERLMSLLSGRGVRALFVLQPYNPLVFRDLERFQPVQQRIVELCETYRMHCLDMYDAHPYEIGTLRDSQHLGELGWLEVSHKAMEVLGP